MTFTVRKLHVEELNDGLYWRKVSLLIETLRIGTVMSNRSEMNDDEEEANKRLRASSALLPPDDRTRSSTLMLKYMHLDADKVLSAYGRFGRYQVRVKYFYN
uniref:RRM domain-containing protein n=1 Tax=Angiostrongylus cantonensis TaxID=6313 RepID=A0A0K0CXP5_ANGCA